MLTPEEMEAAKRRIAELQERLDNMQQNDRIFDKYRPLTGYQYAALVGALMTYVAPQHFEAACITAKNYPPDGHKTEENNK